MLCGKFNVEYRKASKPHLAAGHLLHMESGQLELLLDIVNHLHYSKQIGIGREHFWSFKCRINVHGLVNDFGAGSFNILYIFVWTRFIHMIYDLKYVYSPCLTYQVHRHWLENRHCNGKVKVN